MRGMEVLTLHAVNKKIKFKSNIPKLIALMKSLYPGRIIPEYSFKEKEVENCDGALNYLFGEPKQQINFPEVTIHIKNYSLAETSFMALQLLERLWEEESLYCIEASTVSDGNKGILILGKPRSGKTRLAFSLYDEGFDFISNENTLINPEKLEICGGTKVLNLKKFYWEKIDSQIKKFAQLQLSDYPDYETYLIDMQKLPRNRQRSKISAICEIYIYPTEGKGIVSYLDEFYVRDRLIDFPTALIRGCYSSFNRFEYFGESLDTPILAKKRICTFFHELELDVPKVFIAGNLDFVKEEVKKCLEKI